MRAVIVLVGAFSAFSAAAYTAEDLGRLREANACPGCNLTGLTIPLPDLESANLRNATLAFSDLSQADLSGADLSGATLSWANLTRADLRGTDLRNADLTGASFFRAKLTGALLAGANLESADFYSAEVDVSTIEAGRTCDTRMPNGMFSDSDCYLGS